MKSKIIIITKINIVRHNISKYLAPLGFKTDHFYDLFKPIQQINSLEADIIIIDADNEEKAWLLFINALNKTGRKIPFIILKSNISKDITDRALASGVSGVLLKPFNPEKHVKKVLEIMSKNKNISLKRKSPRYYFNSSLKGEIGFFSIIKSSFIRAPLLNLSKTGASVEMQGMENIGNELKPGIGIVQGTLYLNNDKFKVFFRVVNSNNGHIGLFFENINSGAKEFLKYIKQLAERTFGTAALEGSW